MNYDSPKDQTRLGDLLVEWQLLTRAELEEACQLARDMDTPLGTVLVKSNFLSKQDLQNAIELQSLLRDNLITTDVAAVIMQTVHELDCDLESMCSIEPELAASQGSDANRIGQLLVESGLVDPEKVNSAMTVARHRLTPVGGILCSLGLISKDLLAAILECQKLIRDTSIRKDQGIDLLKICHRRGCSLKEAFKSKGWPYPGKSS